MGLSGSTRICSTAPLGWVVGTLQPGSVEATLDLELWVERAAVPKLVGTRGSMIADIKTMTQCHVAVVRRRRSRACAVPDLTMLTRACMHCLVHAVVRVQRQLIADAAGRCGPRKL